MDNVYTMNHLINTRVRDDREKLIAFFVNLMAAFDLVNTWLLSKGGMEKGLAKNQSCQGSMEFREKKLVEGKGARMGTGMLKRRNRGKRRIF